MGEQMQERLAPGGVRQDCAWGKGTFNAGLEGGKRASRRWSRRRGWEPAGSTHVPPCPTAGQAHTGTSSCALPHGLDTSGVTPPFPTLAAHTSLRVRGGARGPPRGSGETGRTAARAGLPALSVLHGPDGSLSFRLPRPQGPRGGLSAPGWMPVFDMEILAVRMDVAQREVYAK